MAWTEEKAQRRRERLGWRPVDNRETQLPPHIFEQGRELAAMMAMPALDWPKSKWSKEFPK